jgi:hypothetical protein
MHHAVKQLLRLKKDGLTKESMAVFIVALFVIQVKHQMY